MTDFYYIYDDSAIIYVKCLWKQMSKLGIFEKENNNYLLLFYGIIKGEKGKGTHIVSAGNQSQTLNISS